MLTYEEIKNRAREDMTTGASAKTADSSGMMSYEEIKKRAAYDIKVSTAGDFTRELSKLDNSFIVNRYKNIDKYFNIEGLREYHKASQAERNYVIQQQQRLNEYKDVLSGEYYNEVNTFLNNLIKDLDKLDEEYDAAYNDYYSSYKSASEYERARAQYLTDQKYKGMDYKELKAEYDKLNSPLDNQGYLPQWARELKPMTNSIVMFDSKHESDLVSGNVTEETRNYLQKKTDREYLESVIGGGEVAPFHYIRYLFNKYFLKAGEDGRIEVDQDSADFGSLLEIYEKNHNKIAESATQVTAPDNPNKWEYKYGDDGEFVHENKWICDYVVSVANEFINSDYEQYVSNIKEENGYFSKEADFENFYKLIKLISSDYNLRNKTDGKNEYDELQEAVEKKRKTFEMSDKMISPFYKWCEENGYKNDTEHANLSFAITAYPNGLGETSTYNNLTKQESEYAAYLYHSEDGYNKAKAFLDAYSGILSERRHKNMVEMLDESTDNPWAAAGLTAWSYAANFAYAPYYLADNIPALFGGTDLGAKSASGEMYEAGTTARQMVGEKHASKWFGSAEVPVIGNLGTFTYNTLNSMVDSAVAMSFGGESEVLTSLIMGSQAASSTIMEGKERGLDPQNAVLFGILNGITEGLTEKYSLEVILDKPGNWLSNVLRNHPYIKAFIAEGSEELASNWISRITDEIVNGDKSAIKQFIKQYMRDNPGASEDQALAAALYDAFKDDVSATLAGGLSGLGMGAVHNGTYTVSDTIYNSMTGRMLVDDINNKSGDLFTKAEIAGDLAKEALSKNPGDKTAREVAEKVQKGKKITYGTVGKLYNSIHGVNVERTIAELDKSGAMKKRITESGVDAKTAEELSRVIVKYINKENLNRNERSLLRHNTQVLEDIMSEVTSSAKAQMSGEGQAAQWISESGTDTNTGMRSPEDSAVSSRHKNGIVAEIKKEGKQKSKKNAKDKSEYTGIVGVEYSDGEGEIRYKTHDGRVIGGTDVEFDGGFEGSIIEHAAETHKTDAANSMISGMNAYRDHVEAHRERVNAKEYIEAFEALYEIGRTGVSFDAISQSVRDSRYISVIGTQAARFAVESGQREYFAKQNENSKSAKSKTESADAKSGTENTDTKSTKANARTNENNKVKYNITEMKKLRWSEQLQNARHSDTLVLRTSPQEFLKNDGVDDLLIAVPLSVITKAKSGKDDSHNITDAEIRKLYKALNNAKIVIDNQQRNSLVYVTDLISNNKNVVVTVQKNTVFDGDAVHKVTSIHSRANIQSMLDGLSEDATVYIKEKEFVSASGSSVQFGTLKARVKLIDEIISDELTKSQVKLSRQEVDAVRGEVRIDNNVKGKVSQGTLMVLKKIAKLGKVGIVVESFGKGSSGTKGYYQNRVIHINADGASVAYCYYAIHEAVHHICQNNKKGYEVLEKFVIGYLGSKGVDINKRLDEIRALYAKNSNELATDPEVMEELVCNTVSGISGEEEALAAFMELSEKEQHTLMDVLRGLSNRIKEFARRLGHVETDAFIDDAKALKELAEEFRKALEDIDENSDSNTGEGYKLYLGEDSNGDNVAVVTTDQGIFLNAPKSDYSKIVREYFNEHFKGAVLPVGNDGDVVEMSKSLPGEYAYPHTRLDNRSKEYSVKMKAITELENILLTAKKHYFSEDTKGHKEAELGWDYYEVEFICDGMQVQGLINIANSESGRYFYDITKIKVAPAISEKYIALMAQLQSTSQVATGDNITQNRDIVNNNFTQEGKKYAFDDLTEDEYIEYIINDKDNPLSTKDRAATRYQSSIGWVYRAEIFSQIESKKFHQKISEIRSGSNAFEKNQDGEYMLPIENKIVFTDGNFDSPHISRIVEVLENNATTYEDYMEAILLEELGRIQHGDATRYNENFARTGRAVEYKAGTFGVFAWEDGKRSGRDRSEVIQDYLREQYRRGNVEEGTGDIRDGVRRYAFEGEELDLDELAGKAERGKEELTAHNELAARLMYETKGIALGKKKILDVVNAVLDRYTYRRDEGSETHTRAAERIADIIRMSTNGDISGDDLVGEIAVAAKSLIEKHGIKTDLYKDTRDEIESILKSFKAAKYEICLSSDQRNALIKAGISYSLFRSKMSGMLTIRSENSDKPLRINIKEVYDELASKMPEIFSTNVTEENCAYEIYRVLQEMRPLVISTDGELVDADECSLAAASSIISDILEARSGMIADDVTREQRIMLQKKLKLRMDKFIRQRLIPHRAARLEALAYSLYRRATKPTHKNHIPEALREPVVRLLESLDFIKGRYDRRTGTYDVSGKGAPTQHDRIWQVRMQEFAEKLEEYQRASADGSETNDIFVTSSVNQRLLDDIRSFSRECTTLRVYDMSDEEAARLFDIMTRIIHEINEMDALHDNALSRRVSKLGDDTIDELNGTGVRKSLKMRASRWAYFDTANPITFFSLFGKSGHSIYDELRKGYDKAIRNIKGITEWAERNLKGIDKKDLVKQYRKEYVGFTLSSGERIKISVPQIMNLYLLNNRKQGRQHLYENAKGYGYIRLTEKNSGKNKTTSSKEYRVTEADIRELINKLTPEQKELADKMQRYVSTDMAALGNEVSMRRYMYKHYGDPDYWTIVVLNTHTKTNTYNTADQGIGRITNAGHTKSINEHANNGILIGDCFDVFGEHCGAMAMYNGLGEALMDAMKWYNHDGIKTAIADNLSDKANDYFVKFIKDLNGYSQNAPEADKFIKRLLHKAKSAKIWNNMNVVIQQPTAYLRAGNVISYKYLFDPRVLRRGGIEKAKRYSPIAWWKSNGFYTTDIGKSAGQLIVNSDSLLEKFRNAGFAAAGLADEVTWGIMWNACELKVQNESRNLKAGSEEYYAEVARILGEIIDKTQVVDTPFHRAQIRRESSAMAQSLGSFMDEPLMSYNMLMRSLTTKCETKQEKVKVVGRAFGAYLLTALVNSLAQAGFGFVFRYDDDKDDDGEKTVSDFMLLWAENFVDESNIIKLHPYLKIFFGIGENFVSKLLPDEAQRFVSSGNSYNSGRLEDTVINAANTVMDLLYESGAYMAGGERQDHETTAYGQLYRLAAAISALTGVGVNTIMSDSVGFINNFLPPGKKITKNAMSVSDIANVAVSAAIDGNKELYNDMYVLLIDRFDGDSKRADNKLADMLSRSDSEVVRQAILARTEGTYDNAKYTECINKLMELGFTQDVAVSAVNSLKSRYNRIIRKAAEAELDGNPGVYNEKVRELDTLGFDRYRYLEEIAECKEEIEMQRAAGNGQQSMYDTAMIILSLKNGEYDDYNKMLTDILSRADTSESAVKSAVTREFKVSYQDAYMNEDKDELEKIHTILEKSGLYEDVEKTMGDWIRARFKDMWMSTNDPSERKRIENLMRKSKLYKKDVSAIVKGWRDSELGK